MATSQMSLGQQKFQNVVIVYGNFLVHIAHIHTHNRRYLLINGWKISFFTKGIAAVVA